MMRDFYLFLVARLLRARIYVKDLKLVNKEGQL